MHRLALSLLLAACACVSAPIEAQPVTPQRPLRFPTAATVPVRLVELEAGVAVERGERFSIPFTARTGLSSTTEVFANWSPYGQVDLPGDDAYGSGDLRLGLRQRQQRAPGPGPVLAYQLEAKLATADEDKQLGTGENDLLVSAIATGATHGVVWTGTYRLGALGEPGGGLDVEHALVLSGVVPLTAPWSAVAELAGLETPERDRREITLLGGLRYAYAPSFFFDGALIAGLSDDAPDLQFLLGFTAHLGRRP